MKISFVIIIKIPTYFEVDYFGGDFVMAKKFKVGIKKEKEKIKLFETHKQTLLPFINASMHLIGNNEAVIDGCKGVLEYNDNQIKVNIGRQSVTFLGKDLQITNYGDNSITINGQITSLEFCG